MSLACYLTLLRNNIGASRRNRTYSPYGTRYERVAYPIGVTSILLENRLPTELTVRNWCLHPDSNWDARRRQILSLLRLPISPWRHYFGIGKKNRTLICGVGSRRVTITLHRLSVFNYILSKYARENRDIFLFPIYYRVSSKIKPKFSNNVVTIFFLLL